MSDSISDLVVGNRDWSGGCLLSRSKAGLVVIRVCWLEWRVSCDELVGWSWLMIFNLIVPMRSWVGFVALCPVVLEDGVL